MHLLLALFNVTEMVHTGERRVGCRAQGFKQAYFNCISNLCDGTNIVAELGKPRFTYDLFTMPETVVF